MAWILAFGGLAIAAFLGLTAWGQIEAGLRAAGLN